MINGLKKKSKGKSKNILRQIKWNHSLPKCMGFNKSSSKRKFITINGYTLTHTKENLK